MNRVRLRENVFKLLYCNEFHGKDEMPKQCELFFEEIEEITDEEKEYLSNRVTDIVQRIEMIDEEINKVAEKWTTNRMSKVDLVILRQAYYEMKIDEAIPEKVAVVQAVELAKKYGGDASRSFVNGILAKLF